MAADDGASRCSRAENRAISSIPSPASSRQEPAETATPASPSASSQHLQCQKDHHSADLRPSMSSLSSSTVPWSAVRCSCLPPRVSGPIYGVSHLLVQRSQVVCLECRYVEYSIFARQVAIAPHPTPTQHATSHVGRACGARCASRKYSQPPKRNDISTECVVEG